MASSTLRVIDADGEPAKRPATVLVSPACYEVADLSVMLKLCTRTIWRMTDRGEIPGRFQVGKNVRFHKGVIDRWVEQGCPKQRGK
jgi:excisionase family DNA binding protein